MINKMFRKATYCTSGPRESMVTGRRAWFSETSPFGMSLVKLTEWRSHFPLETLDEAFVLHIVHQIKQHLDSRQDDRAVGMLQANRDSLPELFRFYRRLRCEG